MSVKRALTHSHLSFFKTESEHWGLQQLDSLLDISSAVFSGCPGLLTHSLDILSRQWVLTTKLGKSALPAPEPIRRTEFCKNVKQQKKIGHV